ncbi:aminoacyl--tRNA ligase-related protein [Streptomyces sp. NPDC058239]|uniref:aminoacyl--tRNA ligase-related protein n=1 Tax=Streptomyces sp. NPDC058239 TaxID=3346395 RepID=UPI0036EDF3BE
MPGTDSAARTGLWTVRDGLASFGEPATILLHALDDVFTDWGTRAGATRMTFPPLLNADDLRTLDYFRNFPHLGSPVSRIRSDRLDAHSRGAADGPVPARDLADADHLLPSAACYGCFLHFSGTTTETPLRVSTVAQCFRHEDHYDGLRRLWGFTMREIICIGSAGQVRDHLEHHHVRLAAFAADLGLTLSRQPATDPFFEKEGARTVMQLLAPVKDEYVHTDGTAVASMNNHRNFFGERRSIAYAEKPAFTGCVAFGLERWVHVLNERFEGDLRAAAAAVRKAGEAE